MFDRDEQEISQIIENGLEAILSGRATLESVVSQHPEQAEVIRPELEGALWLVSQRQEVEARPGFVTASRKRVVERIKAEAKSQSAKHSLFGFAWPRQMPIRWVHVVFALMMLLSSVGSLLTISQSSLPGDGLYAVKRISETVSYEVTVDEVQRVQLSAQFAERRLQEAQKLVDKGEYFTAEASLRAYEQSISMTLVLFEKVQTKEAPPVEMEQLAVTLKEGLVTNAERLAEIADLVSPGESRAVTVQVRKALSVSKSGMATADRVYEKIQEKKAAATVAPTRNVVILRSTATNAPKVPVSVPTEPARPVDTGVPNTPVPDTAVPTSRPRDTETAVPQPQPTSTPKPTATRNPTATPTVVPTETPLPTETPTDLPVPTNTPVPTKTEAPTKVPTEIPTEVPTTVPTELPANVPEPTNEPAGIVPPTVVLTEILPAVSGSQPTSTPVPPGQAKDKDKDKDKDSSQGK